MGRSILSPINYCLRQSQTFSGTTNVVTNMATPEQKPYLDSMKSAADKFSFRWSAD